MKTNILCTDASSHACFFATIRFMESTSELTASRGELPGALSSILESIHDAVVITDGAGVVSFANHASERLTGLMPAELMGCVVSDKIIFEGKNGSANYDWFWKTMRDGDRAVRLPDDAKIRQFRGETLPVEVSAIPLYGEAGDFEGTVIVMRDTSTEMKVRQRQYEFLSFVSHQLRQPFGTIRWGIELIRSEKEKLSEEHREMLEDLLKLSIRFANFVNNLIDVARFEEGRMRLKKEVVDVRSVVAEVAREVRGLAISQNITLALFEKTPADLLLRVVGDPDRLRDVFQNLLVNAIRYNTPRGLVRVDGGILSAGEVRDVARTSEHSVGIDHYLYGKGGEGEGKKYLLISVADTGLGIPEDQQQDIFNNFFRGRNVQQKGLEGTGLGLFIIKAIIEGSGGRIFFTSKENAGSCFYIVIPPAA